MKIKLAGKVVAGVFFILCCGFSAHSQSSVQAEEKFDNLNVRSFGHGGELEGEDTGKRDRRKPFKLHRVYTYQVLFLDGTEREITGQIKYEKRGESYSLVSKDDEISASDTQYIYRVEKASGDTIAGTSYNNQWLFPVIRGKISGYSTYAENSAGYITHISQMGSKQLQSLASGNKQVRAQTADMLTEMITGNEAAEELMREHLHKARRKALIRNIALGGVGFSVLGIAAAPFATALVVGVPVSIGAGLATVSVNTVDLLEVIQVYNSTNAIAFF